MIKVLHYIDENKLSWAEPWIQLLNALGRRNVDNYVVCASGGNLADKLIESGIPVYLCDPIVSCIPMSAYAFGGIIDKISPDLIHTRLSSAAFIGGWWGKRKNIPVVETLDKHAKLKYYNNATMLLCCSKSILNFALRSGFDERKAHILYNSLDCKRYQIDEVKRREKRLEFGNLNATIISAAGRFDDGKGFDVLIRAFAKLLAVVGDKKKTKLLLLGDGKLKERYQYMVDELGITDAVIMPGFVSDVRPWLWSSDIYVMPSKAPEAFGLSLLEAMASGNAVIATSSGGPEEIIGDGQSGIIVPPTDDRLLFEAIKALTENEELLDKYKCNAVSRALEFDMDKIADMTVSYYNRLMNNDIWSSKID